MILKRTAQCLILCLLAACAPANEETPATQASQTPAREPAPVVQPMPTAEAEAVRKVLEEYPELVLQVIRDNPEFILKVMEPHAESLFKLVELGAEQRRQSSLRESWEMQAASPFEPEIDPTRPRLGPADAPITIIEYSDFECPYCSRASETVNELLGYYPDLLNLYFKHVPLKGHVNALTAAKYFEAAGMQDHDKAWSLYQRFFNGQKELAKGGEEWMLAQASELGLDIERLKADVESEAMLERIDADTKEAQDFGAQGTPYFLVGGVVMRGAMPLEDFEELIAYLKKVKGLDETSVEADPAGQAPIEQAPEEPENPTASEKGDADGDICVDCLTQEG